MLLDICLDEGLSLFQYRNKTVDPEKKKEETEIFFKNRSFPDSTCILLNDDWKDALERNLPVHLGQEDIPDASELARIVDTLGYGASSHNPQEWDRLRILSKRKLAPEYTAFGAIFPSQTKPGVAGVYENLDDFYQNNPSGFTVLIGGINPSTLPILARYFLERKNGLQRNTFFAIIGGIFDCGLEVSEIRTCIRKILELLPV